MGANQFRDATEFQGDEWARSLDTNCTVSDVELRGVATRLLPGDSADGEAID